MSENTDRASSGQGHRERLRERFLKAPLAVPDYELLELLLFYAVPRRDTKPLARALLARFSDIRGVLDARYAELREIDGFGESLATFWKVLREVRARYGASSLRRREELSSPAAVAAMAKSRLAGQDEEECWLALVDAQNRLLSWQRLQHGSVSAVCVHPRDILAAALEAKASGIILVHNHPGGDPHPSEQDERLTMSLQGLSPAMGLRFLDHVIITDEDCYSMISREILSGGQEHTDVES